MRTKLNNRLWLFLRSTPSNSTFPILSFFEIRLRESGSIAASSSLFFMTLPPRLLVVGATGWYGKTLVFEYLLSYGVAASLKNLRLYASRSTSLHLDFLGESLVFEVHPLSSIRDQTYEDYDGMIWYAFLLRNKLSLIGFEAYRSVNDEIASSVLNCLALNPHLRVTFFSSIK